MLIWEHGLTVHVAKLDATGSQAEVLMVHYLICASLVGLSPLVIGFDSRSKLSRRVSDSHGWVFWASPVVLWVLLILVVFQV
jgi:hypothetical protein